MRFCAFSYCCNLFAVQRSYQKPLVPLTGKYSFGRGTLFPCGYQRAKSRLRKHLTSPFFFLFLRSLFVVAESGRCNPSTLVIFIMARDMNEEPITPAAAVSRKILKSRELSSVSSIKKIGEGGFGDIYKICFVADQGLEGSHGEARSHVRNVCASLWSYR